MSSEDSEKPRATTAPKLAAIDEALLGDIKVEVEARLGRATMTVDELTALKTGAVVTLETGLADHVEIYLNDASIARGEIVAVGDKFGVRIIELAPGR
jgi:flagellar motor switch protein FliN/FliY